MTRRDDDAAPAAARDERRPMIEIARQTYAASTRFLTWGQPTAVAIAAKMAPQIHILSALLFVVMLVSVITGGGVLGDGRITATLALIGLNIAVHFLRSADAERRQMQQERNASDADPAPPALAEAERDEIGPDHGETPAASAGLTDQGARPRCP